MRSQLEGKCQISVRKLIDDGYIKDKDFPKYVEELNKRHGMEGSTEYCAVFSLAYHIIWQQHEANIGFREACQKFSSDNPSVVVGTSDGAHTVWDLLSRMYPNQPPEHALEPDMEAKAVRIGKKALDAVYPLLLNASFSRAGMGLQYTLTHGPMKRFLAGTYDESYAILQDNPHLVEPLRNTFLTIYKCEQPEGVTVDFNTVRGDPNVSLGLRVLSKSEDRMQKQRKMGEALGIEHDLLYQLGRRVKRKLLESLEPTIFNLTGYHAIEPKHVSESAIVFQPNAPLPNSPSA